jgi:hypothetical protein
MTAVATYTRAGDLYECAWQLLKYGHFKSMAVEAAALGLGAWARRNRIHIMFEVRRVREHDVLGGISMKPDFACSFGGDYRTRRRLD